MKPAYIAQLFLVIAGFLYVLVGAFTGSNWFFEQSTVYIAASLIVFGLSRED